MTRSPGLKPPFTSGPASTTSPAQSMPTVPPTVPCPPLPRDAARSARLSPAAFTLTRIWNGCGLGCGMSRSSSPFSVATPAFMQFPLLPLTHHARDATRLVPRPRDLGFQIAARRDADIARPHIGPGAALALGIACRSAGRANRIGLLEVENAQVAAGAGDRIFDRSMRRLDDPGATNARYAALGLDPRRHLVLQPADGGRILGSRI